MQGYRDEFAAYCRDAGVIVEWPDDGLRLTAADGSYSIRVDGVDKAAKLVDAFQRLRRSGGYDCGALWAAIRSMVRGGP